METRIMEGRSEKRAYFPWISWGAISGGVVSGMATYMHGPFGVMADDVLAGAMAAAVILALAIFGVR